MLQFVPLCWSLLKENENLYLHTWQIILILAEDAGVEHGEAHEVMRDLPDLWQVDGHLSWLQMKQAGLVDD